MILSYFIVLVNLFVGTNQHVGNVAEYQYTLEGNQINLKFEIEKHELLHFKLDKDCDHKKMTALCTSKYVKKNSTFQINGDTVDLVFENSKIEHGHFIMNLIGQLDSAKVNSIRIHNKCFYEFDSTYKNRVILNIDRFNKSYILKKGKDILSLE